MQHKITILALSRKWGGKCVAGYDHNDGRMIRLVSDDCGKELDSQLTTGVNLLDVVDVDILHPCPKEHQAENVLLSPRTNLTITGIRNTIERFTPLVHDGGNIFGNTYSKISDASNMSHSIELIEFNQMSIYVEDGKTKADFYVGDSFHRWYRVTDIEHEGITTEIKAGYALITLPPSDDFTQKSGYYKYIAAIYPTSI